MADPPRYPVPGDDTSAESGHDAPGSSSRSAKVIGIIVIVLIVLVIALHLATGGLAGLHQ